MPGEFITRFLNKKFNSFSQYNLVPPKLCDLKSFDFSRPGPDYTNPLVRDFYFLKYSSAYITEYFLCYDRIFSKRFLVDGARVTALSLGCGAMLDLVGFEHARRNSAQFRKSTPFYYGVDIIDWDCQDTAIIDNIRFSSRGMKNFKAAACKKAFDVICFPKSLSDIPTNNILDFANSLNKRDVERKFCVIISKRGESTSDSDVGRQFVEILAENLSCKVTHEERDDILTSGGDYFEDYLEHPFYFDNKIGRFLHDLGERCCDCKCDDKEKCREVVGKWPMRWVSSISPEIYYLEKN